MSSSPSPRSRATGGGLASRLVIGQALVLLAGVLTAGLVASLVGPPIFHDHLLQSGHTENSPELAHIEEAYRDASALSLGIALFIALLCAFAVTWLLTRLLRRPLDQLTDAARELSRGHYDRRVPTMGTVTELDALARAFNSMAQRLETVEDTRRRLLSDLAHELRTPIATLTAYHEGIFDGVTELTGDVRDVLTEQTQRLTHLADDITDVSAAEEGRLTLDRQPHTVAELIAAATDSAREHYAAKQVNLLVDAASGAGVHVHVDRQRIGQVLTNLLSNALRHTQPGGTVSIAAQPHGDEITITVTDTGEGMTREQLPHIFERFYRGDTARDRDHSGTGIGLTISKAIIDAHGGTISATSPGPGRGSTFDVAIPRLVPSTAARSTPL